jgi:lipopolysaccharide/colanic/teichoic acid biosynthesis glycosyltransferase
VARKLEAGHSGWLENLRPVNPYGANLNDTLRKLEYDLYYIRYFSFVLDASIVLKTIHIMLFGKGR